MSDYRISVYTMTSAAGVGLEAMRESINTNKSGLRKNDFPHSDVDTWIGRVTAVDEFKWPEEQEQWYSRNNVLAAIGLKQDGFSSAVEQAANEFGKHRIGVIIGTSTSSIGRTEEGYRELNAEGEMPSEFQQPQVHNAHSPAAFVAHKTKLTGPAMTISTACSSSAKVFASASRWLTAGFVDAVLVGGVDSLCLSVIHGFNSLELTSTSPCRPFDQQRDGINIGEAASFALLMSAEKAPDATVLLAGYGESSDAYHMSHPHPDGLGAAQAMQAALQRAGLEPKEIGYVNLHGTASRANDTVEAQALSQLFPQTTLASSTKGWTGHTLGAAGMLEALIAVDALRFNRAPGTLNLETIDSELAFPIQSRNRDTSLNHVMSNSFGFGGNNCSLVFSETEHHNQREA